VQAGTVTGCALSTRSGQPARFQLGGRVPGESRSRDELFRVKALERNTWTLERAGSYFKSMRRHDPEKATDEIIGSPGGATCSGADSGPVGLFQQPA